MSVKSFITNVPELISLNPQSEQKWLDGFIGAVGDILSHPRYEELKLYNHHGPIDCHFHSVFVSYITYKISTMMDCDAVEATRAAALHDFYLYDWHLTKHDELHAWYHPKMAKINAETYFGKLTDKQSDMILNHMWPLYFHRPHSREGMILTFADKYCSHADMLKLSKKFIPLYNIINREISNYDNTGIGRADG